MTSIPDYRTANLKHSIAEIEAQLSPVTVDEVRRAYALQERNGVDPRDYLEALRAKRDGVTHWLLDPTDTDVFDFGDLTL